MPPKGLTVGIEIERKFLVQIEDLPALSSGTRIVQGYLSADPEVRFRVVEGEVILTIKRPITIREQIEIEFERKIAGPEEISQLWAIALNPPLEKVRFAMPYERLVWEIDVYAGRNAGLVTADVEIPHADYLISFPPWIDPVNEITGLPHYRNIDLTRRPYQEWARAEQSSLRGNPIDQKRLFRTPASGT